MYVVLDWMLHTDVLDAFIVENGDGYYVNGVRYWDYSANDVCGDEILSMRLVDAKGELVFPDASGFYGCSGVSDTQAWFTFPYASAYPDTMYLAPQINVELDMSKAVRVK